MDPTIVSRLDEEFRAWAESAEGRRVLEALSAATATHPGIVEGLAAVTQLAEKVTAWAASEEGRCFLQGGVRAVQRMHNDRRSAETTRH